jgi:hypothetical protein
MSAKLIRFDEDHLGYLVDHPMSDDEIRRLAHAMKEYWPEKSWMVLEGDEFIDLTGQFEIVPSADPVAELEALAEKGRGGYV